MSDKTSGQQAYEEFMKIPKGCVGTPGMHIYSLLDDITKQRWEAAAKACQPQLDEDMIDRAHHTFLMFMGDSYDGREGIRAALKAALGVV